MNTSTAELIYRLSCSVAHLNHFKLDLLQDLRELTAVVCEFQLVVILATSHNDPNSLRIGGYQYHHELELTHNCSKRPQMWQ